MGFPTRLWQAFLKSQGVFTGILGIVVGLLLWQFSPDSSVPLVWVAPGAILTVMLVATLLAAAIDAHRSAEQPLPRVIMTRPLTQDDPEAAIVFLLTPSRSFSYGLAVSIYFLQDGVYEQLIGVGEVVNVQEDGRAQVALAQEVPGVADTIARLSANEKAALEQCVIKPTVPGYLSAERGRLDG